MPSKAVLKYHQDLRTRTSEAQRPFTIYPSTTRVGQNHVVISCCAMTYDRCDICGAGLDSEGKAPRYFVTSYRIVRRRNYYVDAVEHNPELAEVACRSCVKTCRTLFAKSYKEGLSALKVIKRLNGKGEEG